MLNGERIVIPSTYRNRILKTLHKGHQGQQRMKAIARRHVYWPSIDKNIEDYVRACGKCQLNAKTPVKAKLSSWPIAERAMQRIHIDFAGPIRSKYYLIIVDSFSKWPEAYQCTTISTAKVIEILSDFFNRFGYPESIVSDNGTQFVSAELQQFCKVRNIRHFKTAPYPPQSNGQSERYVDIVKRALEKSFSEETKDNSNLQEFLLQYRLTPNTNCVEGKTPSELFLGRKLRTEIDFLKKPQFDTSQKKTKMKKQFDIKHGNKLRQFDVNQKVFVKVFKNNKMTWQPGIILENIGSVN